MEAEAAVHGAAAEEVPAAEVPAGAGKAVDLTGKPVFFLWTNNGKPFSTSIFSSKEIIKMFGKAG